jgi:hypothetical protein
MHSSSHPEFSSIFKVEQKVSCQLGVFVQSWPVSDSVKGGKGRPRVSPAVNTTKMQRRLPNMQLRSSMAVLDLTL